MKLLNILNTSDLNLLRNGAHTILIEYVVAHSCAAKSISSVTLTTSFDSLLSMTSLQTPPFQYFSSSFSALSLVAERSAFVRDFRGLRNIYYS